VAQHTANQHGVVQNQHEVVQHHTHDNVFGKSGSKEDFIAGKGEANVGNNALPNNEVNEGSKGSKSNLLNGNSSNFYTSTVSQNYLLWWPVCKRGES